MEDIFTAVVEILLFSVFAISFIFASIKFIKTGFAPVKTVKAEVLSKSVREVFSKYGNRYEYIIVFIADDKRLCFKVNEFSYSGYKEKEVGYLTYKGNKIINFS